MRKLISNDSIIIIQHYKNFLESEGIKSKVVNEHFGSIMGEIPFQEIWPELWVKNALDFDRASFLINQISTDIENAFNKWICEFCKEEIEENFCICWNCGNADSYSNILI